jgi:hypothetical protein
MFVKHDYTSLALQQRLGALHYGRDDRFHRCLFLEQVVNDFQQRLQCIDHTRCISFEHRTMSR